MDKSPDMPDVNSLNLKPAEADASGEENEMDDPLTQVAESQCGDMEEWHQQETPFGRSGSAKHQPSERSVLDHSINLKLTNFGVRQVLGRKPVPRPKPLLKLICKGCGMSTHDTDEFIADDWVECHGRSLVD